MLTINVKKCLFLSFLLIPSLIIDSQAACKPMGDIVCYVRDIRGNAVVPLSQPPIFNQFPCKPNDKPNEISGACIYDNSISSLSETELKTLLDNRCNNQYPNDCISMSCTGKLKCDAS